MESKTISEKIAPKVKEAAPWVRGINAAGMAAITSWGATLVVTGNNEGWFILVFGLVAVFAVARSMPLGRRGSTRFQNILLGSSGAFALLAFLTIIYWQATS